MILRLFHSAFETLSTCEPEQLRNRLSCHLGWTVEQTIFIHFLLLLWCLCELCPHKKPNNSGICDPEEIKVYLDTTTIQTSQIINVWPLLEALLRLCKKFSDTATIDLWPLRAAWRRKRSDKRRNESIAQNPKWQKKQSAQAFGRKKIVLLRRENDGWL